MARKKRIPIGLILRDFRKRAHLTQERVALRLGVSISYVSRVELGKEHLSIDNFVVFAKALRADPGELLNAAVALDEE